MTKAELTERFKSACRRVTGAEAELTEIDSKFGDADHGITMTKIAAAIEGAVEESQGGILAPVMMINGGSAVPLWNTWLDGMQEAAPEGEEISAGELKEMFRQAYETLFALSKAKVGDKTMMDALIPATEAMQQAGEDEAEIFAAAADAAMAGAEASRNFVSRFGRARSYGEATIGTPDAGAVSMSYFFAGLAGK